MILKIKSGTSVDAFLLAFVKCVTTLLGLLSVRIISDNFSYLEYGTYNQAILIASSISSITIIGFTDATNYYFNRFSEEKQSQEKYLSTIVTFQLCVGLIAFVFILLAKNALSSFMDNNELNGAIQWVALTPLLTNIIAIQQIIFISIGKSRIIAVRNFVISIIKLLAVFISVYITNNIVTILVTMLLFDIFQMLYFSVSLSRYGIKVQLNYFNLKTLKSILNYSIPLGLFIVTNTLMCETDKYIVSCLSDSETFAIYSNSSRILPFAILTDAFTTVLIPIITKSIYNNQHSQLLSTYKNYLNLSFVIMWILISGAIISSPELIQLLYGTKYVVGLSIFIIYLLVTLVKFANFSFIFSCAGQTKTILNISLIALVSNAILSLVLYYIIGVVGCALATLLVSIFVSFYYLLKTRAILNTSFSQLMDFRAQIRVILYSVPIAIILYLFNTIFDEVSYILRLIFSYGTYVIMLIVINRVQLKRYLIELNK